MFIAENIILHFQMILLYFCKMSYTWTKGVCKIPLTAYIFIHIKCNDLIEYNSNPENTTQITELYDLLQSDKLSKFNAKIAQIKHCHFEKRICLIIKFLI